MQDKLMGAQGLLDVLQGHVQLLQSLQTRFPAATTLKSNKGLTAEQLLFSASTTYTA